MKILSCCLIALGLLVLTGCNDSSEAGRNSSPDTRRIVALGGEVSETLVALGLEEKIIGVDTTSTWPQRLRELPSVGYLRQLNVEGILSLQPDLIIASHDAGPTRVLEQWRSLGINVIQVTTGPEIEQAYTAMREIGRVVGRQEAADALVEKNRAALRALPSPDRAPRVLFMLSRAGNLPLVSGSDTKAHTMIEAAGGVNVAAAFEGYKPATPEAIVDLGPDLIIVPSHGLASFGGRDALLRDPAIRSTPAGANDRIIVVDSQLVLSLGPRLGEAIATLRHAFGADETPRVSARGAGAE